MVGVCFEREKAWEQDQWSFVFSNFGITDIWERNKIDDRDHKIYQQTIGVATAAELPDVPLVVLAHEDSRYIKGSEALDKFTHPDDAIYLFGGSHANLNDADDLGGREPDHLIYIPSVKYEMYSHAAAYITLYDRYVKRGDFG